MSVQVKRRREAATFLAGYVGAQGELLVDTTNNRVQVHDGATPGGWPAARLADLPSSTAPLSVAQGGTGKATRQTPTVTVLTGSGASGTYAPPSGCTWFRLKGVGCGAGGAGSGTSPGTATPGGSTTFGSITLAGGNAASGQSAAGGATGPTGGLTGNPGMDGILGVAGMTVPGGIGGATPFGGGGPSRANGAGRNGVAPGAGGGGAGASGAMASGCGGGGGTSIDNQIFVVTAGTTYAYALGTPGVGGTAGTGGFAGGAGAGAQFTIEENYT